MGKLLGPREDKEGKPGWAPQATPRVRGTGCWDLAAEGLSGRKPGRGRGQLPRSARWGRDAGGAWPGVPTVTPPHPSFPSALQEGLLVNSSPWVTLLIPRLLAIIHPRLTLKPPPFSLRGTPRAEEIPQP